MLVKKWRYFMQSVHKAYWRPFGFCKVLPNAWMDTKVFSTLHMTLATIIFLYNYPGVESCGHILCRLVTSMFLDWLRHLAPHQKMIVRGQRDLSFVFASSRSWRLHLSFYLSSATYTITKGYANSCS